MAAHSVPLEQVDTKRAGGPIEFGPPDAALPDMRQHLRVEAWRDGDRYAADRTVPEEVPVAFRVNSTDYAVMLASPRDIEDFAVGFMRTEGVITRLEDLEEIEVMPKPEGIVVRLILRSPLELPDRERDRRVAGVTGCGLCGVESLREAIKPMPWLSAGPDISPRAVLAALADLRNWQPNNALSGALHAAAFAGTDGRILLAREDVGRHNALDKLIGALHRQGIDPDAGFVVMSSRCSFELVQKVARSGIRLLCTVSSPTALAVRLANQANLSLITQGRSGELLLLSGAHRVTNNEGFAHAE